jgi:predicted small secreted protein
MKKVFFIALAVMQIGLVTACNTVAGAGQDIQNAGHAVKTEAREER